MDEAGCREPVLMIPSPAFAGYRPALAIAVAAALATTAGCSSMEALQQRITTAFVGRPSADEGTVALQPLAPVRRDIFTRSYRLGETYTVQTGGAVVSIKNYSVTERVGRATVLRDFGQTCTKRLSRHGPVLCDDEPLASVRGAMGSVYDVPAAVTLPDGQFFAVALPPGGTSQIYLLVDPTGRLRRGGYLAFREDLTPGTTLGRVPVVGVTPEVAISSEEPLFSFESVEKFVYMGPGYLSFDLVFTGTRDTVRGELMNFSYREFGRDSTERPAFERQLQFAASDPVIEVERLRIEVEPTGYNELRFRVIADGQPEAR